MPFTSSMCAASCGNGGMIPCAAGVPRVESYVIGGFITETTGDGIEVPEHPHWLVTGQRVNTLVMAL